METVDNLFVQRKLENLYAIERDIIRLYAEACYSNIQAAYGNRTCMCRGEEFNQAMSRAVKRLKALKAELGRLGVPSSAMFSLDDLQCLDLFETQFKCHDAVFDCKPDIFLRSELMDMIEDLAATDCVD